MPVFITEDGTGLPDANQYIDVATANSLLEVMNASDEWTLADETTKNQYIADATIYIDQVYGTFFKGYKRVCGQALSWPRTEVYCKGDNCVTPFNIVPLNIQKATAILADRQARLGVSLYNTNSNNEVTQNDGLKSVKSKVGPLEKSQEWFGSSEGGASQSSLKQNLDTYNLLRGCMNVGNQPLWRA